MLEFGIIVASIATAVMIGFKIYEFKLHNKLN
jgi:hypothetical protein